MNKLKLKNHKDGNIKEICYTLFHRGFSDSEIVKDYGFILKTVSGYRYKLKFKIEQKDATELLKERDTRTYDNTPIFSISEMDYGTDLPQYSWNELNKQESNLIYLANHRRLKQLNKLN
tara:strand:+ start:303 stop:659 length:357 start_codon:yes stop_codon:yes gene_type:complete